MLADEARYLAEADLYPPGQGRGLAEDYNTVRRHSALGMKSPVAYEQALAAEAEAA